MNDPFRPDGPSVTVNLSDGVRCEIADVLLLALDGNSASGYSATAYGPPTRPQWVAEALDYAARTADDQGARAIELADAVALGVGDVVSATYRVESVASAHRPFEVTVTADEARRVICDGDEPDAVSDDPADPRVLVFRVALARSERALRIYRWAKAALGRPVPAAVVADMDDMARRGVDAAERDGDRDRAEVWWQVRAELDGWTG